MKSDIKIDHRTGNYVPYSFRTARGFFNVPQMIRNKGCETGPTVYRPYPRRLESQTVCRRHGPDNCFSVQFIHWLKRENVTQSILCKDTIQSQNIGRGLCGKPWNINPSLKVNEVLC